MKNSDIPGTFVPRAPHKSYRLRQALAEATASASAVDLLRELALGQQPERALTIPPIPQWAVATMEARAHG